MIPRISNRILDFFKELPTKNFNSVFLTKVEQSVKFWKFSLFHSGTWRQWSRKFPSRIIYTFWTPHEWKIRFSLFDQSATKWVPGKSISLRNLTPMVPKVSLQDFLFIFGAPQPKITNRSFWLRATKWFKFPNFSPRESTSHRNLRQYCQKFPSRIFYSFWPPYHQKFRFDLFHHRATKRCF